MCAEAGLPAKGAPLKYLRDQCSVGVWLGVCEFVVSDEGLATLCSGGERSPRRASASGSGWFGGARAASGWDRGGGRSGRDEPFGGAGCGRPGR